MNRDGHPVFVSALEDAAQLRDMPGVIEINIGIAEVQLEAAMKIRILCTPRNLGKCVRLQRIDPAKRPQSTGKLRHLARRPVVFRFHLRVLILNRRLVRIAILIRQRQDHRLVKPAWSSSGIRSRAVNGVGSDPSFAAEGLNRCW